MKVLILNSPLFREINEKYEEDSLPALGLGYIATNLRKQGVEVVFVDAVFERISLRNIISRIEKETPDFVAVNIFTTNKTLVKEIIQGVQVPVHFIVGGLSTKQLYKEILTWRSPNPIDIVTGDGELITFAIVNNNVEEAPYLTQNSRRVFQVNDGSIYLVKNISEIELDRSILPNEPIQHWLGFVEANIIASRGCVYNCAFCAAARSIEQARSPRERTNESLIRELHSIEEKFPQVNSIRVLDDLFLKGSKSILQAIDVFSRFSFQWRSMAHVSTFNSATHSMMLALKASGCHELFVGIESGSPDVLKRIHKTCDIEKIVENLSKAFRAGINIKGYFIYGFPDETEEEMEMTFQLAQRLKDLAGENGVNFRTSVFQFRPYHGTELYHNLESQGIDLEVSQYEPNIELSGMVGRQQFNFHSGNYSSVENQILNAYIYRTNDLNGGKIFANLQPHWRASPN